MNRKKIFTMLALASFLLVSIIAGARASDIDIKITQVQAGVPYRTIYEGSKIKQGDPVQVQVYVKNNAQLSIAPRVEVGLYPESLVNQWFRNAPLLALSGWGVTDIPNCVPSETNVDTVSVNLAGGQSKTVSLVLKAPFDDASSSGRAYNVFANAFLRCYGETANHDTGSFDTERWTFFLTGTVNLNPTCSDHLLNQDETDIDCGGTACKDCADGYHCVVDSNCVTSYCDKTKQSCTQKLVEPTSPISSPVVTIPEIGQANDAVDKVKTSIVSVVGVGGVLLLAGVMIYLLVRRKK